jgi:hypothetical protein
MPSVYDIAMELQLNDKASEGLRGISDSLAKIGEQLRLATEGFSKLSNTVIGGAGIGLALGLERIMTSANKFTDSMIRMRMTGVDAQRAMQAAILTQQMMPTTTTTENLERARRLFPLLGPAGFTMLPQLTRAAELMEFAGAPGGLDPTLQMASRLGLTQPGRQMQLWDFVNQMTRVVQATQGQVTPQMMQQITRMAGITGMTLDPEMMTTVLPALAMSGIGGRGGPGQALAIMEQGITRAAMRAGGGGGISQRAFRAYFGRNINEADEMQLARNPYQWMQQNAQRFRGVDPQTISAIFREVFTNPQAAAIMATFLQQGEALLGNRSRFAMARAAYGAAPGATEEAARALEGSTDQKLRQLGATFTETMHNIARINVPDTNKTLDWMNSIMGAVERWTAVNPEKVHNVSAALEGLSAGMILLASGRFAIAAAAFIGGGPVGAAIIGIAATITLLAALNWQGVQTTLNSLWATIHDFLARIGVLSAAVDPRLGNLGRDPTWQQKFWWAPGRTPNRAVESEFDALRGMQLTPRVPSPPVWTGMLPQGTGIPPAPRQERAVNLGVTLAIDGRTLASTVIESATNYLDHPLGAAAANPWSGSPSGDSYQPR